MPSSTKSPPRPALLEHVSAAIGAIFALGLVGYLGWDAMSANTPPDIEVRAGTPYAANGGQTLPVFAFNRGGTTAAEVTIEVTRSGANGETEVREISFDFIPGQSERSGAVVFEGQATSTKMRVIGYREP